MYENRRGGSVFGSFLLGGIVGAVLGLLFAPRSGRETREIIADRAEEYWGQGVELYNTGKERATEMVETGRERITEQSTQLRGKIDEARDRLQEQVSRTAETARAKVDEVVPAAKDAVDRAAEKTKSGIDVAGSKAQGTLDMAATRAGRGGMTGETVPTDEPIVIVESEPKDTPPLPEV